MQFLSRSWEQMTSEVVECSMSLTMTVNKPITNLVALSWRASGGKLLRNHLHGSLRMDSLRSEPRLPAT
jgi:hypothetical protein